MTRTCVLAGLLLLAQATAAATPPLGRLFFTPAQRQALTEARLRGETAAAAQPGTGAADPGSPAATAEAAPPAPRVLVLEGLVVRRQGPSVAWINGTAVEHGGTLQGYRVEVRREGVRLYGEGRIAALAVGQRFDLDSGTVGAPLAPDAVQRERRR